MAKRTSLSKNIRFEVFKRDSFKCQYCGRSAPDVILEVDHVVPVSEGGDNDLLNLVTSCRDCNRGKSNKKLTDTTAIDRQKKQLDDLNEIREQTQMLIQWKQELLTISEEQIDSIDCLLQSVMPCRLNESGRKIFRKYIKRFGFGDVYDACELAFVKYQDIEDAINKVGGICYNWAKKREGGEDA